MRRFRHAVAAIAMSCAISVAACDDSNGTSRSAPDSARTAFGEVLSDSARAASATAAEHWLSDGNVLSLFNLVNGHQVAVAQLELAGWHSDIVRSFAAATLAENNQVQASVDSVGQRIHTTPVAPALDSVIAPPLTAEVDSLKQYRGAQMDQAFMTYVIRDHAAYVVFLGQLAAAAERPELRDVLLGAIGREQLHLARARAVRTVLAAAAADSAAKARPKGQ